MVKILVFQQKKFLQLKANLCSHYFFTSIIFCEFFLRRLSFFCFLYPLIFLQIWVQYQINECPYLKKDQNMSLLFYILLYVNSIPLCCVHYKATGTNQELLFLLDCLCAITVIEDVNLLGGMVHYNTVLPHKILLQNSQNYYCNCLKGWARI